jgi:hypothetical protein
MAKNYQDIYNSVFTIGNKMDFTNTIIRGNGIPLDIYSVFDSYNKAVIFAASNAVAYEGEILAVTENGDTTVYVITPAKQGTIIIDENEVDIYLKEVGTATAGDNKTIILNDGILGLKDFEQKYYAYDSENKSWETEATVGWKEGLQPKVIKNSEGKYELAWFEPSTVTVEGLSEAVTQNTKNIEAINDKIGEISEDETIVQMISGVSSRVSTIEGDYLKAEDKTELSEAINEAEENAVNRILGYLSSEEINTDYDTLKEVAEWIESDTTNSAELITRVSNIEKDYLKSGDKTELQNQISELELFIGDLPEGIVSTNVIDYIQEVIAGLKIGDYAKASELTELANRVSSLEGKVKALEDVNSEKNIINEVDENQFNIDENRKLTLLDIAMGKVTGLEEALEGKADSSTTLAGYGITDAYTKGETYTRDEIADLIADITGGESAADVLAALNAYKGTNDERVSNVEDKLSTIEENADENIIEIVKVNGTAIAITDKAVDISIPVTSEDENKVTITEDKTMEINSVNVNKLVQTEGEWLILNGGTAEVSVEEENI